MGALGDGEPTIIQAGQANQGRPYEKATQRQMFEAALVSAPEARMDPFMAYILGMESP